MDYRLALTTLLLLVGVSIWFYVDLIAMKVDYEIHSYLIDPVTSNKLKPNEALNLTKVLNLTENYLEETNAQERLYDLVYNLNLENPFINDQRYSSEEDLKLSGWPVADQSKCGHQLKWILDRLTNMTTNGTTKNMDYTFLRGRIGYELTQLMDTFGKPESGLFSGIVTWPGSYKQCTRLQMNEGQIKMRYCWAKMRPKWWPETENVYPRSNIRIGVCLPETCDTQSFVAQRLLLETLVKFNLPEFYKEGLEFDSMYCLPDERSPIRKLPLSGHIYLAVLTTWLSLVITATIVYEISLRKKKARAVQSSSISSQHISGLTLVYVTTSPSLSASSSCNSCAHLTNQQPTITREETSIMYKILKALSIRNSMKLFKANSFRVRYKQGERVRVDLGCLDLFKVFFAFLVILAHSCLLASVYTRNLANRIEVNLSLVGRMVLSVARVVDTFFILFGLLSTYTMMRKFSPKQLASPLIWFGINMSILVRISPVFMLVYWFSKTVSPYIGAGPWWDYGTFRHSAKGVCMQDSWWKSILYFGSSGSPGSPMCVPPAWFLVDYAQISLILPILTYILIKLPKNSLRFLLVALMSLMSATQTSIRLYTQNVVKEEAFTLYGSFLASLLEKFESTGNMSTIGKLGTVAFGSLVGYLLRQYELGKIKQWPKWVTSKITHVLVIIAHAIIILLPVIGKLVFEQTNRIVKLEEFLFFNALAMILWPILNAILILNYTTTYNHTHIVRFCSHSFWHIFNRLGLCIFLVHWEIIFIALTNFEQGPGYGFLTEIYKIWGLGVFFSIVLALILHLLVEAPLSTLLIITGNLYIGRSPNYEKSQEKETIKSAT